MPRIVCRTFHCRCGHSFKDTYGTHAVIMGKPTKIRTDIRCPECSSADVSEDRPYRWKNATLAHGDQPLIYERRNPKTGEYERFTPARNDFPTPDPAHYGAGWEPRRFTSLRELEQYEHFRVGRDNPHLFNEILNYDNPDTAIEHSDPAEDPAADLDIDAISDDDIGGAIDASEAAEMLS